MGTALAAGIAGGASTAKISPALPFLQQEFGLSLIAAGWLASMFNLVAVCGALLLGIGSDRAGALRFCILGLSTQVAGGTLALFASAAPLLLLSRLIEGLGFIATAVAAPVLMAAAAAPEHRRFAFTLWAAQMPVGGFLIIVASPLLLGMGGWRALWGALIAAMLASIVLIALQSQRYASVAAGAPRSLASIRESLAQPVPWLLGAAFAACAMQFYTMMVWLPTYLLQTRGLGAFASSLLTAAYVLASACGTLGGCWLVHRQAQRGRTIGVAFGVTALLFLAMFAPPLPDALRFVAVLACSFVISCIPPTVFGGVMRYARSTAEAGSLQGLIAQLTYLGAFLGAPLVATVVTWSGTWNAALGVLLAGSVIGGLAAWGIHRIEARDTRAVEQRHSA